MNSAVQSEKRGDGMFEETLYTHLINAAEVKAIVQDRIYPLMIPQNKSLPAVTYQKISGERLHSLQGDTGYTTPVFQISARAETYAQCKALAQEIRLCLQNFTGQMGGTDGLNIGAVLMLGEVEGYEPDTGGWYSHMDFQFHYEERVI